MPRLIAFEQVSLDGYFVDGKGDMSWAKKQDPEWNEFASANAGGGGVLVFGRVTYDMMAGFWPTAAARQMLPAVAEGMNNLPKLVFSRTMKEASWRNTTLVNGDPVPEMEKRKARRGPDLVILGSGSIVSQLAQARLIDEFQIALNPVVLGRGRTLFEGLEHRMDLTLARTRVFGNGNVVLCYERAA